MWHRISKHISAIDEATLLRYPDYPKKFFSDTDASQVEISGVLHQSSGPLAFYSHALNNAEKNYSTTDGGFLSLLAFRPYLPERHFHAFTDHQALPSMVKRTTLNTRPARYIMKLDEFDFDLAYRKGEENSQADCLSRLTHPGQPHIPNNE